MIRFGSRVDVYLPEGVRPLAAKGQTATAGAGDGPRRPVWRRPEPELPGAVAIRNGLWPPDLETAASSAEQRCRMVLEIASG
jgi:hypothetical protein